MPAANDLPYFPMYVDEYLNDPAVLNMSLKARGAYSTLLFSLWRQTEPGVAPVSETALATLARATPEEWAEVRDQVSTAFTRNSSGAWVQKRMVTEFRRLSCRLEGFRKGAEITNIARQASASRAPSDVRLRLRLRAKQKDSDSVPVSGSGADAGSPAAPVPVAARIAMNSVLKPATPHPDAVAAIEAMRRAGLIPALRMLPDTSEEVMP